MLKSNIQGIAFKKSKERAESKLRRNNDQSKDQIEKRFSVSGGENQKVRGQTEILEQGVPQTQSSARVKKDMPKGLSR